MRVTLTSVSKGPNGIALPETSVAFVSGSARLAIAETEQRPTILGLLAAGRMRPDTGEVLLDGKRDAAALRRRVALVDAPDVSDPAGDVTVAGIVAEELMFAGRRSDPVAALRRLDELEARDLARIEVGILRLDAPEHLLQLAEGGDAAAERQHRPIPGVHAVAVALVLPEDIQHRLDLLELRLAASGSVMPMSACSSA